MKKMIFNENSPADIYATLSQCENIVTRICVLHEYSHKNKDT
jgi:hypothetical protein